MSDEEKRMKMILMEKALDQGMGSQRLANPDASKLLSESILREHQSLYVLDCFVIMPNHVHVLFYPKDGLPISKILQSWKGVSAKEINKTTGSKGRVWQPEYWDRLIRNETHFNRCRRYILNNPVKAGLTEGFLIWQAERGL